MAINPARLSASQAYRVSSEVIALEQSFDTALDTDAWYDGSANGGTITRNATTSAITLAVGTANGARARLRSHARPKAAVGRSRTVSIVANVTDLVTSQRKRWGLFDDGNGHFFELDAETLYVVRRSNVSGSVVDTRVPLAQWNKSTARDPEFTHVWEIRETWPAGDILFFVDGELVHTVSTKSNLVGPAGRTNRLPVTLECENTNSTVAGALEVYSVIVTLEAAPVSVRTFSEGATNAAVPTTDTPLLCLRPAVLFSAAPNLGELLCDIATGICSEETAFRIYVGATVTGGTWAAPNAASIAEVNTTAASFTGGTKALELVVDAGFSLSDVKEAIRALRLLGDGTTPDTLVIAAAAATGTVDARVALSWKEIR